MKALILVRDVKPVEDYFDPCQHDRREDY